MAVFGKPGLSGDFLQQLRLAGARLVFGFGRNVSRIVLADPRNSLPANPDSPKAAKPDLLAEVKAFQKSTLAGKYYESFAVNYRNFMEQSRGTMGWIAECNRLLDCCVKQVATRSADRAELCEAFDIIFGLLDHIDECRDDIIFFADEGGSWQVGIDWDKVLPAWFEVLSATAAPDEYASRITALLDHHYRHGRDRMLAAARRAATPRQRSAIAAIIDRQEGGVKP